ncbi:MAG TPA: hypothetical protein PK926_06565 [Spirochaetota bacterium]|nr:hypothetical protein [Spirochaetota bacterium]HPI91271.1 hypothetical protein [Spirochaetota bacterium]HPR49927.1 hypothetical protein [Spirochaetota bacterium]
MGDIDFIIKEILVLLNSELPDELQEYKTKFEDLVNKNLLRASYDVIDELCRQKKWKVPIQLKGLLDKYKAVF